MPTAPEPIEAPPKPPAGTAATGRNLVVCCDGTNNTLTGGLEDTNVLQLHGYLRRHADPATTCLYYDPGVGSPDAAPPTGLIDLLKRRFDRFAGLASGRGVYENIGEGYRFLMQQWRPADRIFCFGFSRGAFTARAVVGMVNLFGVLRPEHEPMIPTLVRIYFSQPPESEQIHGRKNWRRGFARWLHVGLARPGKPAAEAAQSPEEATAVTRTQLADEVRRNFSRPAAVHWVGVWDTVESVGLPLLGARDNPATATFHDKPGIHNVRHALALDEHRWPFLPRLYDAPSQLVTADGRTLKQRWFPGVHCDVGGSYPPAQRDSVYPDQRNGLADAALAWMVNEVADELRVPRLTSLPAAGRSTYDDLGMPRRRPFPAARPLRHDALHDTPYWALAGMTLREMRTQRVLTNAQHDLVAAAAGDRGVGSPNGALPADDARSGRSPGTAAGVDVDVSAPAPAQLHGPSVWDERRKAWPLVFAALIAAAAMALAGRNLADPADPRSGRLGPRGAYGEACSFVLQQVATVSPWPLGAGAPRPGGCRPAATGGWRDPDVVSRYRAVSTAWAIVCHVVFIAAFGYLIARAASRVFTWLAGFRRPGQPRPGWLLAVGWLPAAAVGAHLLADAAVLLVLALPSLGLPALAGWLSYIVGALAVVGIAAGGLCVALFGGGRLVLAVLRSGRVGSVGRRPAVDGGNGGDDARLGEGTAA